MTGTQKLIAIITLSGYADENQVDSFVKHHHDKWSSKYSKWSYESTKHKLLAAYWTRIVPMHFFILFCSGFVLSLVAANRFENLSVYFATIICCGLFVFLFLYFVLYRPVFMDDYSPLLHHVTEQISGASKKELENAKKDQYSAVAIVLIQLVTSKLAGFAKPTGSKLTKDQLTKLYGISERSFHDALNVVLKGTWKESPRMQTEIADAFGEAREYFSLTNSKEADKLLDQIKIDVLIKRQPPTL